MKKMKKTLCLFLALVMCLGMVNLSAFADEGETVHEHTQLDCATCGGTGEVAETVDMTPYESANAAFRSEVEANPAQSEVKIALGYLEAQGLNIEDPFVQSYAEYMVRSADYDQACRDWADWEANGDTYGYVEHFGDLDTFLYYGMGFEGGADHGPEAPVKTAGTVDCPDCEGGKVPCTGEFVPGKLVKNEDGTGTVTYTCATCGVSYDETRTHAEVVAELGDEEGHIWGEPVVVTATDCTEEGSKTYTCTVEDCDATKVEVIPATNHERPESVEHVDATCTEDGYDKYVCPKCEKEITETIQANGHSYGEGEVTTLATCTVPGVKTYTCAKCGEVKTEEIAAKHNFKNGVCKNCGAVKVTMYGVNMGHWYGYVKSTAEDYRANIVLGAEEAITADSAGFVAHEGRGEFVTNYATTKVWQLVGFVPETTGWGYRQNELAQNYVYTNSEQSGDFKVCTGLDEVKAYVEANGVLYNNPVPATMAGDIVAVWFVDDAPTKPGQFGAYDLNVEPVAAPALRENSTGVSIGVDPDTVKYVPKDPNNNGRGAYTVNMVIRIDESAPDDVHVNIVPGLAAAAEAIDKKNGGEGFEPGDAVILNISIDNQSGKAYSYVPGSGFVATNPDMSLTGNVGTGFDGFQIPVVENSQYSYIARRTNNQPLKDMGLDRDVTDAAVGAALKQRGYGKDSGLSDEQIAQTYLADYYLDWTNAARSVKGLAPVSSFQELGLVELSVFTNGTNNVQVFESCEDVVEGLYYFYYGAACTYNGKTIYQQMQDYVNGVSELDEAIPAALNGTDYDLNTLGLDGEHVNNGYQNTQFSFRMEFDLSYTPEPVTPPPVSTPHYYYQLITYYITHLADGTIRYDGVNVQQVEVTEGKHNDIYQANEGDAGKYFFAASDYTEYKDNSYSFIPGYTPEDSKYRDSVHEIKLTDPNTRRNPYTLVMWYERTEIEEEPTPLSTTLTVEKVWEGDGDVQRPANVTVQLMKDGAAEGAPIVLSEANEWSYTWIALDAQSTWTVAEVDVPEGYTSSSSTNEDGTIVTITNTYTPTDVPDEEPPKTDTPDEPVDVPDEQPPLTDLPDEQPPLAEIPVDWPPLAEIPVEQPPLVEVPEDIPLIPAEPEVTVPEEPLPMVGIPQTGDFSMVWCAVAILSALGLAVLTLKKREGEEG